MLYLFEDYILDCDRRELRRGVAPVAVEPQVLDLLAFLVGNRDRLISKDDLIRTVWGGRIVSESTLDSRVNAARRVIGDSGKQQRLIRTTIGKGIRFVGTIREEGPATASPATAPPSAVAQPMPVGSRRWQGRGIIAAVLLLIAAAGLGAWWTRPSVGPAAAMPQASPVRASAPSDPEPRMSIVVLPFADLSGDSRKEYSVDALANDLTAELSHIDGSFVISRTTASTYKGKPVNVKQIGLDLGVRYALEGGVRSRGEQVQVDVQLTDARSGASIWAGRFETDGPNRPQAQSDMIGRLAAALEPQLIEAVARQIEREQPERMTALDHVIRGWAWYDRPRTDATLLESQLAFEQALQSDPQSVDAEGGLATVLTEYVANGRDHPIDGVLVTPEEDLARAEQLLRAALASDRNHRSALFALGRLRRLQNRLIESQIELEKVVAIDRYNPMARIQLGITLLYLGKPEAAIPQFEKFRELSLNAQNIFYVYFWLGYCHLLLNQPDLAIDSFRQARVPGTQDAGPHLGLAAALGLRGDIREAKASLIEARKIHPKWTSLAQMPVVWPNWIASPAFIALREKTMDAGLRRAGMPDE